MKANDIIAAAPPAPRPVKRIGHKGAGRLAPGNTLASFEAALAAGVDVIEFDVISRRGRLVLAHSLPEAFRRRCVTLAEALAHLASERYGDCYFNVDLKLPGYEHRVLAALAESGLAERCLLCSQFVRSLDRLRAADPTLALGVSVGGFWARRLHRWGPVQASVAHGIRSGRFDALLAHHKLVCAELVAGIADVGGEVYAWTADDPRLVARMIAAGVDGVTTNDPRVFWA